MSARIIYECDHCGSCVVRDVHHDAACGFTVRVGYPEGWVAGDEGAACSRTECQAAMLPQTAPDVPDNFSDGDDAADLLRGSR